MINVPVAVVGKAIVYPGLSFGLRGEQSVHLHHKVAGPEKKKKSIHETFAATQHKSENIMRIDETMQ